MADKAGDTFSSSGYKYQLHKGSDGKLRPRYLGKESNVPKTRKKDGGFPAEVLVQAAWEAGKAIYSEYEKYREEQRDLDEQAEAYLKAMKEDAYAVTERLGGFKYRFIKITAVAPNGKRTVSKVRGDSSKSRRDALLELGRKLGLSIPL